MRKIQNRCCLANILRYHNNGTLQHAQKYLYNSSRPLFTNLCNTLCKSSSNEIKPNLRAAYDPKEVECKWHEWWDQNGYFRPSSSDKKPFVTILPPPNVTGTLHLGHALTCTIQDVLARWHRMQGKPVLWIPGMDHAGIATQVVVEKKLWQEKKLSRHDIGREKFMQEVWQWKNRKEKQIKKQLTSLGLSLDWSREVFTMDSDQSTAVVEAFVQLFDAGLIYRENALVNWSCVLHSAISDVEVEYKEIDGATGISVPGYEELVEFGVLTDFAYKLCDKDDEIVVSTTRLETMLGDVAIAVHPQDSRYSHLHGESVWHPFQSRKLPIIFDEFINPNVGTGAVKITPAHDYVDFEVGKRHKLQLVSVIDEKGHLTELCGEFKNMKRFEARKAIYNKLKKMHLLRGARNHTMQVPFCSRSGDVVEYLIRPQWFVACKEMGKRAREAVEKQQLCIDPPEYEKTWFTWLEDLRDWCISRQLWWGHQIPAYECCTEGEKQKVWVAARNETEAKEKAAALMGSEVFSVRRDEDVLDTWFSSSLLPFSSLGWPQKTEDLRTYYPLSILETGHDILFFWVARMVMLGTQLTGQLPFKDVLLHGIICDTHGRKMSKSLGNVVYPEDIINGITLEDLHKQVENNLNAGLLSEAEAEKAKEGQRKLFPNGIAECGADALRFTLCSANIKNQFMSFDVKQCESNRHFCNKMWQATKYMLLCVANNPQALDSDIEVSWRYCGLMDKWIMSRLSNAVTEANRALGRAELHLASAALKTFFYNEFCDVYLESTKPVLKTEESTTASVIACKTLLCCINTALLALSPFMPFVTEELYQLIPRIKSWEYSKSIMIAPYPQPEQFEKWRDEYIEKEVEKVMQLVSTVRHMRSKINAKLDKPVVHIITDICDEQQIYARYFQLMQTLLRCEDIVMTREKPEEMPIAYISDTLGPNSSVYLYPKDSKMQQFEQQIHSTLQRKKMEKELTKLLKTVSTKGFQKKAPEHIQKEKFERIKVLEAKLGIMNEAEAKHSS